MESFPHLSLFIVIHVLDDVPSGGKNYLSFFCTLLLKLQNVYMYSTVAFSYTSNTVFTQVLSHE